MEEFGWRDFLAGYRTLFYILFRPSFPRGYFHHLAASAANVPPGHARNRVCIYSDAGSGTFALVELQMRGEGVLPHGDV
jgi:hypothetical protein